MITLKSLKLTLSFLAEARLSGCLELTDVGLEAACASFGSLRSLSLWMPEADGRGARGAAPAKSPRGDKTRRLAVTLRALAAGLSQLSDAAPVDVAALPSLASLDLRPRAVRRARGWRCWRGRAPLFQEQEEEKRPPTTTLPPRALLPTTAATTTTTPPSSRRLQHLTCLNLKGCEQRRRPGLAGSGLYVAPLPRCASAGRRRPRASPRFPT